MHAVSVRAVLPKQCEKSGQAARFRALPWISYLFYRRRFLFHEVTHGHSPLGTRHSLARPATITFVWSLVLFRSKET
jgi:hypothetical protein